MTTTTPLHHAPSSTPAPFDTSDPVFSDQPTRPVSSPPSSPPGFPWELHQTRRNPASDPSDNLPSQSLSNARPTDNVKNVFSVLGKRKPLDDVNQNARPQSKKQRVASKSTNGEDLTQMQMSLGQRVRKTCEECGMEYVVSSAEDRKVHDKYHKQSKEGYDVGRVFVQQTKREKLFRGVKEDDHIVALDCFDEAKRRRHGQAVLEIAQKELGAVPISEGLLWDRSHYVEQIANLQPKYRLYLYIRGTKCLGLLLAEKVKEAYEVLEPVQPAVATTAHRQSTSAGKGNALEALRARKQSADETLRAMRQAIEEAAKRSLKLSDTKFSVIMGISRIWTSTQHRGQHIATTLLNISVKHHNWRVKEWKRQDEERITRARHQYDTPREEAASDEHYNGKFGFGRMEAITSKKFVAFSQPTEAGIALARKWYGRAYGWGVYVD